MTGLEKKLKEILKFQSYLLAFICRGNFLKNPYFKTALKGRQLVQIASDIQIFHNYTFILYSGYLRY